MFVYGCAISKQSLDIYVSKVLDRRFRLEQGLKSLTKFAGIFKPLGPIRTRMKINRQLNKRKGIQGSFMGKLMDHRKIIRISESSHL